MNYKNEDGHTIIPILTQEEAINVFNQFDDVRIFLRSHPDQEMITRACLHSLGDSAQAWYNRTQKNLCWKTVFNSEVPNEKRWGHIDNANKAAKDAGYSFFTWNGWVYGVDGNKTEYTTNDLA